MDAAPRLPMPQIVIPTGPWRWLAGVLALIACLGGLLALAAPASGGWAGLVLVGGLGTVGVLLLFVLLPATRRGSAQSRRVAEAASKANIAWAIANSDGAVIECNEAYRRIAAVARGEAAAPPELALSTDTSAAMLYRLARSASAGRAHEERCTIASGIDMLAMVRPLADGHTAWWFTPVLSVGATAEAKAAVATSVSIATLLADAPIGIAIADRTGRVAEANKSFAAFFAVKDMASRTLADHVDGSDRPALVQILSGTQGPERLAPEIRAAGSTERMAELYAEPLHGDADKVILYLVDVSEQKALETKFAQSQKMQAVGQLAGGVAHDFNNLLTVIIGNSEFLLSRHQAGDPSFREINDIHQNAIRAANLVRQLLAFSRQQTMQPRVLDLRVVTSELGELLRRLLREGIDLRMEQAEGLWPVYADEAQLTNAIINLVVNARDAMPKGGTVSIRTANETLKDATSIGSATMMPGDYVRIDVADTGIGIPKEYVGKIFEPFFTTKPTGQGTGLGLATVYGIVKQMRGFISVESEVGRGTTFSVYLPRHHGEVDARPEAAPLRDITGEETILLVEDEDGVRSFAARALKQRGYQVLEASGGEQALEIVRARADDIALIITDVVMPNMDGPTLVRAARKLRPDIHVIFMSGYAEEAFRRNEEKAEDLHFLPKPFGLKQLAAKVKDVLSGVPRR
jgi:signal transduction histidine kinase/CheY-like chemotaxis protein